MWVAFKNSNFHTLCALPATCRITPDVVELKHDDDKGWLYGIPRAAKDVRITHVCTHPLGAISAALLRALKEHYPVKGLKFGYNEDCL